MPLTRPSWAHAKPFPGSVVYLHVEVGGVLPAAFIDNVAAWVAGMTATDYRPGVYCSHFKTAAQITGAVGDIPVPA